MKILNCRCCGGEFQVKNNNKSWVNCSKCRRKAHHQNYYIKNFKQAIENKNEYLKHIQLVRTGKNGIGLKFERKEYFNYSIKTIEKKEHYVNFIKKAIAELQEELQNVEENF